MTIQSYIEIQKTAGHRKGCPAVFHGLLFYNSLKPHNHAKRLICGYIDEQTGQLTVLLTETGAVVEDEIARLSGATTGILFQECDISYNDITETVDTLSENIAYFEELGIFIDGISDDILNGKVIVLVQDLNADKEM